MKIAILRVIIGYCSQLLALLAWFSNFEILQILDNFMVVDVNQCPRIYRQ